MKKTIIILALLVGIGIGSYNQNILAAGQEQYVGRALIDINTGKIIEYQGGAYYNDGNYIPLGTLMHNAINNGLDTTNLKEKYILQTEYKIYMDSLHTQKNVTVTYQQAINDLNLIINNTNPTNAQVVWAIKRLAEIEKAELQYYKLQTELN